MTPTITKIICTNTTKLPKLWTKESQIVDECGNQIILKGLALSNNAYGDWVTGESNQLEENGKDPLIRPKQQADWVLQDIDFNLIKEIGSNVVRYSINYELFAADNKYRETNLQKLKTHIEHFNAKGIYVIIALHYGPGLDNQNDIFEREKPGNIRMKSVFEDKNYWDQLVAMWTYLAANLCNLPGIAGYEIFNEPRLPSNADGGMVNFKDKFNKLIQSIRNIDLKHIIFVPEYISCEANPGEKYYKQIDGKWVEITDQGEQGIIWFDNDKDHGDDPHFIQVKNNIKGIVYVNHLYRPASFTHEGKSGYDRAKIDLYLRKRIQWAKDFGHAPLFISEYGSNRMQPAKEVAAYLRVVNELFEQYRLSSTYFEYKTKIGAYSNSLNVWGLYGQYVEFANETDDALNLKPWAIVPAQKNQFNLLYDNYFRQSTINPSLMDNQLIWDELHRHFTNAR